MTAEEPVNQETFEAHRSWADENYRAIVRIIDVADDLRGAAQALQNCTVADPTGNRTDGMRRAYRRLEEVFDRLPPLPRGHSLTAARKPRVRSLAVEDRADET